MNYLTKVVSDYGQAALGAAGAAALNFAIEWENEEANPALTAILVGKLAEKTLSSYVRPNTSRWVAAHLQHLMLLGGLELFDYFFVTGGNSKIVFLINSVFAKAFLISLGADDSEKDDFFQKLKAVTLGEMLGWGLSGVVPPQYAAIGLGALTGGLVQTLRTGKAPQPKRDMIS